MNSILKLVQKQFPSVLAHGYHSTASFMALSPLIKEILTKPVGTEVVVKGWVKSLRIHKNVGFVTITDGSNLGGIQCVIDNIDKSIALGSSMEIHGTLVKPYSEKHHDAVEVSATQYNVIGDCNASDYPLQKKHNPIEYLRGISHLRPRSPYYSTVYRIRDLASQSIHEYMHQHGCYYVHTPIITSNDCEGAGETFSVLPTSTLEAKDTTKSPTKDSFSSFFGTNTYLTVSGQLQAEMLASALSRVYTFGPTFRAENSNSTRHLSEFWMVEPELMWADMKDIQSFAEGCVKHVVQKVLNQCPEELSYLDKINKNELVKKLTTISTQPFCHMTYTEAVEVLKKSKEKFVFPVEWGCDLQTEHEKYLTDVYCKKVPVFVTDYPKTIKPFYMKVNEDNKTVQAMDLLVPQIVYPLQEEGMGIGRVDWWLCS